MESKSSANTFYFPPHSQTVTSRDLLTVLDDETPSPPKGVKKMFESVEQISNRMRDREWKEKRQQRDGIARAKRQEGKMKTL
jgi:hypothetical protein